MPRHLGRGPIHAPPYKRTGLVHRLRDLFTKLARKLGFSDNVITHSEIANVVKQMRENALQGKHESKTKAPTEDTGGMYSLADPEVPNFIARSLKGENLPNKVLGEVKPEHAKKIESLTGIDVTGFKHELVSNSLRHMIKNHGDPKVEAKRNPPQIAITEADLNLIPEILENPDDIVRGATKDGRKSIRYMKRFNGHIVYVETVANRKGSLQSKTL